MNVPLPARLLLTMALAVSAAWPSPGIAAAATPRTGSAAAVGARPITLIDGESIIPGPAPGGPRVAGLVAPPGQPRQAVLATRIAGRYYVIPADLAPYLGRGLDPDLFDLGLLAQAEAQPISRIPVSLTFRGPRPRLPGVRITHAGQGHATGYLTPASAPAFGAALAARLTARTRTARGSNHGQRTPGGLLGHDLSVTLNTAAARAARRAEPPAPRSARDGSAIIGLGATPGFVMHTLTIHATELQGQPDSGDLVQVTNVDNSRRFEVLAQFDHGVAKLSLPSGHYWALATFFDFFHPHPQPSAREVVIPQFTVAANTSLQIKETAASSEISMATPRPAVPENVLFDVFRTAKAGPPDWEALSLSGGPSLWVSPTTARPSAGRLLTFTNEQLVSPATAPGLPYEYDLAYAGPPGIVPAGRHRVRAATLATVNARYFQDVPSAGAATRVAIFPRVANELFLAPFSTFPLPRHQIEYMTGNPALRWWDSVADSYAALPDNIGGQQDALRAFTAGQRLSEDWNAYPLSPAPAVNLLGPANLRSFAVQPDADRSGRQLRLSIAPFSDSQPGHAGPGYTSGSYELDQNGDRIAGGQLGTPGNVQTGFGATVRLDRRPSVVRLRLRAARPRAAYPLSPVIAATWTWRSEPRASVLPSGWVCDAAAATASRQCTVQPLLTLRYAVSGLSLAGVTRPGPQHIRLRVSHLQLAAGAPITSASMQVSVNDGRSWRPARVRRVAPGRYLVLFDAPAGRFITLRARASDAAGGSVTETILRGYRTAIAPSEAAAYSEAVSPRSSRQGDTGHGLRAACPAARPGQARCFVLFRPETAVNAAMRAGSVARPAGWGAKAMEAAYRLPVRRRPDRAVAVSIAGNNPRLAADLAVYRRRNGLPPCTVAAGCLTIVNQKGQPSPLPPSSAGTGWDLEADVDVSMISAACPHCRILVVEAGTPAIPDLAATEPTAVRLGAGVVSNSYGAQEYAGAFRLARDYSQPGHVIVAASGDAGFGPVNFPAALRTVTAVGGTQLRRSRTARGWSERVWNNRQGGATASGCSAYVAKPKWQHDRHCAMRTVADVAAVAAGVAIYDRFYGGWLSVSGTSIAAPLIAGGYALAGNADITRPGDEYRHRGAFYDITQGSNVTGAERCGGDYLCVARHRFDAPTGLGPPDGTGGL